MFYDKKIIIVNGWCRVHVWSMLLLKLYCICWCENETNEITTTESNVCPSVLVLLKII